MQAYCIPLVSSYPPASSLPSGGPFNADPVSHCLDCLLSLLCIHPTLSWQSHLFYAPPESENVQSSKFTLISQIRAFRYSLQLPIGISHRRFKYFMHTISSFASFSSPPSPFFPLHLADHHVLLIVAFRNTNSFLSISPAYPPNTPRPQMSFLSIHFWTAHAICL